MSNTDILFQMGIERKRLEQLLEGSKNLPPTEFCGQSEEILQNIGSLAEKVGQASVRFYFGNRSLNEFPNPSDPETDPVTHIRLPYDGLLPGEVVPFNTEIPVRDYSFLLKSVEVTDFGGHKGLAYVYGQNGCSRLAVYAPYSELPSIFTQVNVGVKNNG